MTQVELAQKVGVAQGTISKFITGRLRRFNPDTAAAIVKATGGRVTLDDLLFKTPFQVPRLRKLKKGAR